MEYNSQFKSSEPKEEDLFSEDIEGGINDIEIKKWLWNLHTIN